MTAFAHAKPQIGSSRYNIWNYTRSQIAGQAHDKFPYCFPVANQWRFHFVLFPGCTNYLSAALLNRFFHGFGIRILHILKRPALSALVQHTGGRFCFQIYFFKVSFRFCFQHCYISPENILLSIGSIQTYFYFAFIYLFAYSFPSLLYRTAQFQMCMPVWFPVQIKIRDSLISFPSRFLQDLHSGFLRYAASAS